MSRITKNIILLFIIMISIISLGVTIYFAGSSNNNMPDNMMMQTPPSMHGGSSNNSNGTPPSMPGNSQDNTTSDSQQNNNGTTNNQQAPPDMQNDSNESNMNSMPNMNNNNSLDWYYYALFGIESIVIVLSISYLILSNFNKKSIKETFENNDKKIIYILSTIILSIGLIAGSSLITSKLNSNNNDNTKMMSQSSTKASGALEITSKKKLANKSYKSRKSNENAILVSDGGSLDASDIKVNKTGDSSNTEESDFSGVNAAILAQENSNATIKNATISTNGKGANAIFATGSKAKINISNSKIITTGESSSRGLDATYGGTIIGDNLDISTTGASSATLATDRGEGTVTVSNSKLSTKGTGSPLIYSTGKISVNKTTGNAENSQIAVVEGKNSIIVKNSNLIASGKGNRGSENKTDQAGVMIYQSMSGDAGTGTGTFTATKSTLEIDENSNYYKTAPMFFVTNTKAKINLSNTKLNYGSNILLSIKATDEWGNSGKNGGKVTLNAKNQELAGDIEVDKISTLKMNLTSSSYTGTINKDNTAKKISIKLDKNTKITLTGDSYVSSLEDEDGTYSNIDFNGYKLYVNGKAIN